MIGISNRLPDGSGASNWSERTFHAPCAENCVTPTLPPVAAATALP
jgi:hypothetical protein